MKKENNFSRDYFDSKFNRTEELLRMVLVSNISLEMSLSTNMKNNIGGQYNERIVDFDESRDILSEDGKKYIETNNMIYHGRLRIFRSFYYLVEIVLDLKPAAIKDVYKRLKSVLGSNIIFVFENLIDSRKRNLKNHGIPYIMK